ncbi:RtcB family protein [Xenorhabdus bovienii]|uniref:RtcB family protein n=1 Tax=Xenorhabdus bovienii TaxID=40576 RepID=UPI0023B25755|nr:RtcB family protein [Xenorhabdus bovienii]MDE9431149.1 RtcB family protein [Xenorhabdus bovienii]MDE9488793.1 RtcB family protein [Xenorhabdus bovienii]MDE9505174.1 RtcB family protein [Xenorhabdus bovienii]MDE9519082.1 RtcB family protein [Xenorhabdus bovienii]MDE9548822.1 RtcB family protein [Xenorhabdus bovienii]
MGNTLHLAASRVQIIAAENTWLEGKAIQQLETTAQLPDMVSVVGLPDLHPGRGYPVGAAFFSHSRFYPALIGNVDGWLHRKGATPSDQGAVIIPGSRGDYSYLVQPLASDRSLFSLAHGAGRKWMRGECKARLTGRYNAEQLSRTAFGSRVICLDKQLIFQEAPEAYKPIGGVMDAMLQAGLVKLIARLKPVLTYKTRGNKE